MFTSIRTAAFIVTVIISLFYGWIIVFQGNEWMVAIGASGFTVIGVTISFMWIYKAYLADTGKRRYFWLLLNIGLLIYIMANLIWFIQVVSQGVVSFPNISSLLWLFAYITFLLALLYKTKLVSTYIESNQYIFNVIVFMIVVTAISIHYLIEPILIFSDQSVSEPIINVIFQVVNLSILFVISRLYYLAKYSKENIVLFYIIAGFFLHIIADSSYAYLTIIGIYQESGGLINPLWMIGMMVIGLGGVQAHVNEYESKLELSKLFKRMETVFPYVCSVILVMLVIKSYAAELNALSLGLTVIFMMIIGRQLLIINKNEFLMRELKDLAYHDMLTGLKNRTSFEEDIDGLMKGDSQYKHSVALLLIDLDQFKFVNDTLGHQVGDDILRKASNRLKESFTSSKYIYRLGGDEFVIIVIDASEQRCVKVAEEIIDQFAVPFLGENYELIITPSIGISMYPNHEGNSVSLLKNADTAMYLAKEKGKNNFCFYNSELHEIVSRRMKIENELHFAIEKNQFSLFYQPKIELQTRKIIGMEALLRWNHPELGIIFPDEFIPIAEETGKIDVIGEWVLKTACQQNKTWQDEGLAFLCLSVNVSVCQFQNDLFPQTVRNTLQETKIAPEYLELEITENAIKNIKKPAKVLNKIKATGVRIAIDNFGSGYTSLYVLKELPIDVIKIDKLFICDMTDRANKSIIKMIINIGFNLNLCTIAEGIEHEHEVDFLLKNGCRIGQGFLFLKPMVAQDFRKYIKKGFLPVENE